MPFKSMQAYLYVANMNVTIWKKTRSGLDPDYPNGLSYAETSGLSQKPSVSITGGFKFDL
jgi:hypothetical protein